MCLEDSSVLDDMKKQYDIRKIPAFWSPGANTLKTLYSIHNVDIFHQHTDHVMFFLPDGSIQSYKVDSHCLFAKQ